MILHIIKQKQRIITKPTKKKNKSDCENIIEIFKKMKKTKKGIMLTTEKSITDADIERRKEHMRMYYY